jgi:hypothetical protein
MTRNTALALCCSEWLMPDFWGGNLEKVFMITSKKGYKPRDDSGRPAAAEILVPNHRILL